MSGQYTWLAHMRTLRRPARCDKLISSAAGNRVDVALAPAPRESPVITEGRCASPRSAESSSNMGKTVKVTDLTKLEGDPDPRNANVPNVRMYLEMHARAPWQVGFVKFVARCSEHAP